MRPLTIGLITIDWFPRYGGAVIYAHRLLCRLAAMGHKVSVATATLRDEAVVPGEVETFGPAKSIRADDPEAIQAWCLELEPWLARNSFSHVLINAPLTRTSHAYARGLFAVARGYGSLVGAIHLDLGRDVAAQLSWEYAMLHLWDAAAERVLEKIRTHLTREGEEPGYFDIESPCYFRPDFVVSCSEWSGRFIDPLDRYPRFVLHPLIGDAAPVTPGAETIGHRVHVSFINPLAHKGVQTLVDLTRRARPEWRFRVLQGGYGNGLNGFLAEIQDTDAWRSGRVDVMSYCANMGAFYDCTALLLFPSLYEGYGMAAVEALFRGTPVVAREYPSIVEGVGDGARLVPFSATGAEWFDAISETLGNLDQWRARAGQRACALRARENAEMHDFTDFLEAL